MCTTTFTYLTQVRAQAHAAFLHVTLVSSSLSALFAPLLLTRSNYGVVPPSREGHYPRSTMGSQCHAHRRGQGSCVRRPRWDQDALRLASTRHTVNDLDATHTADHFTIRYEHLRCLYSWLPYVAFARSPPLLFHPSLFHSHSHSHTHSLSFFPLGCFHSLQANRMSLLVLGRVTRPPSLRVAC